MSENKPSKSARKREYAELKALGEKLIGLDRATLAELPIDETLLDAVVAAGSMTAHGALRRQKQLIGKYMSGVDAGALRAALDNLGRAGRDEKRVFAAAERWRDRILGEGDDAISDFLELQGIDRDPQLEDLHKAWQKAGNDRDDKRLRRSIFRHIHAALMTAGRDGNIPR